MKLNRCCCCRFTDMVIALRNCLAAHKLPVYFNNKVNLLSEYKPCQLQRISGYLKRVANKGKKVTGKNNDAESEIYTKHNKLIVFDIP